MTSEEEFVERIERSANDLALLYAGEPDDRVAHSLAEMRRNLECEFAQIYSAATPEQIGEGVGMYIDYIMEQRREICAGGITSTAKV